jgi:glycosyltransferase involved in cell wall biosynthesis
MEPADLRKNDPLVSVIIPAFNCAAYISEALDSVLGQSYRNLTVVVVDDGSSDRTAERLMEYLPDGRVIYLPQSHGGVSKARNTGICNSGGEYIAFLDADDYWPRQDKLRKQITFLQDHAEVGWIFGDAEPFDDSGSVGPPYLRKAGFYGNGDSKIKILDMSPSLLCREDGFYIPTGTLLIRRECLDVVGLFDERLSMFEDFDLWFRLGARFPIAFMPEVLLARRVHEGNTSAKRFFHLQDLERVFRKHDLKDKGVSFRHFSRIGHCQAGRYYLGQGRPAEARREYYRSFRYGFTSDALAGCIATWIGAANFDRVRSLKSRLDRSR